MTGQELEKIKQELALPTIADKTATELGVICRKILYIKRYVEDLEYNFKKMTLDGVDLRIIEKLDDILTKEGR